MNFKRLALTDFKVDGLPRAAKKTALAAALKESGAFEKFAGSAWGQKLAKRVAKVCGWMERAGEGEGVGGLPARQRGKARRSGSAAAPALSLNPAPLALIPAPLSSLPIPAQAKMTDFDRYKAAVTRSKKAAKK